MLQTLFTDPILFFLWLGSLIIAITIHEFAHAFAADRLGDPTPRLQGRLTLNPLSHLDPLGTILMIVARFGWGKPVVFDPYNLKNPKRDAALISIAGPLSNISLAILVSLFIRFGYLISPIIANLAPLAYPLLFINVMLAIFNLVPVHPLDGGKILIGILPNSLAAEAEDILNRYGTIILILLIFPFAGNSAISALINPAIQFVIGLLLP